MLEKLVDLLHEIADQAGLSGLHEKINALTETEGEETPNAEDK